MSKELKRVAALSMVAGSIGPLLLFIFVIIGHDPWYAPQYIVPITGMLVGNAMTGVSLGANTFLNNMKSQRGQIEGALMLGATPKEAAARSYATLLTRLFYQRSILWSEWEL